MRLKQDFYQDQQNLFHADQESNNVFGKLENNTMICSVQRKPCPIALD